MLSNTHLDSDFVDFFMRFLHDEVHHLLNLSARVTRHGSMKRKDGEIKQSHKESSPNMIRACKIDVSEVK